MSAEKSKGVLGTISFGTGILCRKIMSIGKVAKTKEWKKAVSKTGEFVEHMGDETKKMFKKVGKSVTESVKDMKESFEEGMELASEEERPKTNDAEESVKTDVEIVEKNDDSVDADSSKRKADIKVTVKKKHRSASKKFKSKVKIEKEDVPVNDAIEKEIDALTKEIKEV